MTNNWIYVHILRRREEEWEGSWYFVRESLYFIEGEGDGDIISIENIMNPSLNKLQLVFQWETFLTTSEVFP